jgi:hypothetical protein
MLEVTTTDVTYVEGRRTSDAPISGLGINIQLDDVLAQGEQLEITFTYTATYAEGVGLLTVRGKLTARGTLDECQQMSRNWRSTRKLTREFAEEVLNTINYVCGTNGTFVARAVNLSPPMMPPKIEVTEEGAEGVSKKQ